MRKWIEEVKPYPRLRKDQPYRVRVVDVSKDTEAGAMEVTFEFLDSNQFGRRLRGLLSLPIRPYGLTADYFSSCHIEVKLRAKISPRETIGSEIVARFKEAVGGHWQPIRFEPVTQEQGEENEPIQSQSESTVFGPDVFTVH
jgi:hypothetical protein